MEVWENENAVGTQATGECFNSFFEFPKLSRVFLELPSINLLAFYHECHPLIGYATRFYSVIDSE